MNVSTSTLGSSTTQAAVGSTVLVQLAAAFFLGLVMVYAVGFSESSVAHNAAHDVRHANGRPCH